MNSIYFSNVRLDPLEDFQGQKRSLSMGTSLFPSPASRFLEDREHEGVNEGNWSFGKGDGENPPTVSENPQLSPGLWLLCIHMYFKGAPVEMTE